MNVVSVWPYTAAQWIKISLFSFIKTTIVTRVFVLSAIKHCETFDELMWKSKVEV